MLPYAMAPCQSRIRTRNQLAEVHISQDWARLGTPAAESY
jgi:hypothetical protein